MRGKLCAGLAIAGCFLLLAATACNSNQQTSAPGSVPVPAATVADTPAPEPPGIAMDTDSPPSTASHPTATAPPPVTPASRPTRPPFIPVPTPDIPATVAAEVHIRRQVAEQVSAALAAQSTPTPPPPALEGPLVELFLPPGPLTAGNHPTLEFTVTNRLADPVHDLSIEFAPSWPSKLHDLTIHGGDCIDLVCQVSTLAGNASVGGQATLTVELSLETELSLEATASWHSGDSQTRAFFTQLSRETRQGEGPGSTLWQSPAPSQIGTCEKTAVVDYEAVYATVGEMLYAFSRTTGNVLWKFEADDSLSSPAVSGNSIFFTTTVRKGARSHEMYLYSLNTATGSINWRSPLEPGIDQSLPLVHERAVYVTVRGPLVNNATEVGHLMSFDALTGVLNWSLQVEKGGSTPPMVSDGRIYFSNSTNLFLVDHESGQLERKYTASGYIFAPPVLRGTRAYIISGGGSIYSWDYAANEIDWEYKPVGGKVLDEPVVSDRYIYFLIYDDVAEQRLTLEALDIATGAPVWKYQPGSSLWNPSVANGRVYVASWDSLASLDAETGQTHWAAYYQYFCDFVTEADGVLYVRSTYDNQKRLLALRGD
ncbi:MAG: PQQ-binding-like beta-propeller repeat protein [Chloroflexi bacterium]|nr:PQQ-binding-like beta-propeller repeat protein [Chloroflexota bacterium]